MRILTFLIIFSAVTGSIFGQDMLTPAQTEGPYYPVSKPSDRDADLARVIGRTEMASGDLIRLSGVVSYSDGTPLSNAVVEIWQTDSSGIYRHPSAPNTDTRDRNFQFYGESTTDSDGRYEFLTVRPEPYGSRPRHIHVKIRAGSGRELLTTQFYFPGDSRLETDRVVERTGDALDRTLVDIRGETREAGRSVLIGHRDVVLPR